MTPRPIKSEELDRRIELQSRTVTKDAAGGPIITYVTFARPWAKVGAAIARSVVAAQQLTAEADTVFTVRFRSDITLEHRVVYRGNAYDIVWHDEVGRKESVKIYAKIIKPQPAI